SLAICEFIDERFAAGCLWPADPVGCARARSVASEMHAGFAALRMELPMNVEGPRTGVKASGDAEADIDRIIALWRDSRQRCGGSGQWLFGEYSVADAMFAPVTIRFST